MVGCDYMALEPDQTFSWVFFIFVIVDNVFVVVVVEVDSVVVVGNIVVVVEVVIELVLWKVDIVVVGLVLWRPLADMWHGMSGLFLGLLWLLSFLLPFSSHTRQRVSLPHRMCLRNFGFSPYLSYFQFFLRPKPIQKSMRMYSLPSYLNMDLAGCLWTYLPTRIQEKVGCTLAASSLRLWAYSLKVSLDFCVKFWKCLLFGAISVLY